ncbi:MAG: serpin family protein, partial [Chloroflexi bacterium]|nr:serpin family protein [Chloroflexota bacterium]
MKLFRTLLIGMLVMSFLLSACNPTVPIEDAKDVKGKLAYIADPQASQEDLAKMAEANNQFAMAVYQLLAGEENLIYSPYSIYQALVMTYAGAEGETEAEMMKVLGLSDNEEAHNLMNALNKVLQYAPDYGDDEMQPLVFSIANALWAQKDYHFEQSFLDKLSANYAAGLKLVDFNKPDEAQALINTWVAAQTNDKIKDLIPDGLLSELTRLVLTNAVYFKGAWRDQFDVANTQKDVFTTLDGGQQEVDMMSATFEANALVNEDVSAAILPYLGRTYAMALIMPEDFLAYQKTFDTEVLESLLVDLEWKNPILSIKMPRFKTESTIDLKEKLIEMGMPSAFTGSADFSGMTGNKDLLINDVVHKAFIDVNEEGTEAAA